MKLLSKSEITKAKAKDRELEVAEGLKLAKKVDGLRELAVNEDKALQTFRTQSLSEIQRQILEVTHKRDSLQAETTLLEERKLVAQAPLDDEWAKVSREKEILSVKTDQLVQFKSSLDAQESSLNGQKGALALKESKIEDMHKQAQVFLTETDILNAKAEKESRLASSILAGNLKEKSDISAFRKSVEVELNKREETLKARELQVVLDRKELGKKELQLRDREEILTRNKKR